MAWLGMHGPTTYGQYVNQVEVYRGRNKLYNELLTNTGVEDTLHQVGKDVIYHGRRIPRSEIAKRVSHMDAYHMKHLAYNWFFDA